jgi:hypothetical protein
VNNSRVAIAGNVHGSQPSNFRADPPRTFHGDRRGNFRGDCTQAEAFGLSTNDWNKISAQALNDHAAVERLSAKELAIKIGCNDRTIENYLQGRTAPSGVYFLKCLAAIPEFQSRVLRLCALERDCDPEAERARSELIRAAQKYADAKARASIRNGEPIGDLLEMAGCAQ